MKKYNIFTYLSLLIFVSTTPSPGFCQAFSEATPEASTDVSLGTFTSCTLEDVEWLAERKADLVCELDFVWCFGCKTETSYYCKSGSQVTCKCSAHCN